MNSFGLRGQHGDCGSSGRVRPAGRERGQSMVLVALMLVAFIGFLAMVIDLGNVYAQRRFMQSAADAGALAGVQQLALQHDATAVDAAVNEYACSLNGAESYGLQILSDGVVVSAATTAKLFFAPVLGIDDIFVGAVAEAGYSAPGSASGAHLVPIAIEEWVIDELIARGCVGDLSTSCQVSIWEDVNQVTDLDVGIVGAGQRGWLNLNGENVGAPELKVFIQNGYDGEIVVNSWVNGTPGVDTTVLQVFNTRVGETVIMPVYNNRRPKQSDSPGTGNTDYYIIGFAAFDVTGVQDTAHPKGLYGRFMHWVTDEPPGGTVSFGTAVIGLR